MKQLLELQKRIYRSLQIQVDELLGSPPAAIIRYEDEYKRDLHGVTHRAREISKKDLRNSILKSEITLIADFHSHEQAQRTALRLIRDAVAAAPDDHWILALEMISSDDQALLDAYQKQILSEARFLKEIDYAKNWGFPWLNYEPLFSFAREAQMKVIGINCPPP